ncbi:hypothetical protein H8356DRAFT_1422823 [Neocallimastix lanati (nom. inval.)]|nr:hypothetical protein H8356DRAFT_1427100 [Neocallimastix sp. JGI-2020a]KAG4100335.1 hypothetical protein H8356DRAFT_1422823 [Neocallimastix sp. JGI-2020a]
MFFCFISSKCLSSKIELPGRESSLILLSINNTFNYNEISNLIVFGVSHSYSETNFGTIESSKKLLANRKNWPVQLSNMHKMKLWNFV